MPDELGPVEIDVPENSGTEETFEPLAGTETVEVGRVTLYLNGWASMPAEVGSGPNVSWCSPPCRAA